MCLDVDKEMVMVDILFKEVLFMVRFFVLIEKFLLLLFQDCLNVAIV